MLLSVCQRPWGLGREWSAGPKALASQQCPTEATLAGPTSSWGFNHVSLHPSSSRNVTSFKVPLASRHSNQSFREKQEVGPELGVAIRRRDLGLALLQPAV